jgi:hypothetical protein
MVSKFAFKCNLCRYTGVPADDGEKGLIGGFTVGLYKFYP